MTAASLATRSRFGPYRAAEEGGERRRVMKEHDCDGPHGVAAVMTVAPWLRSTISLRRTLSSFSVLSLGRNTRDANGTLALRSIRAPYRPIPPFKKLTSSLRAHPPTLRPASAPNAPKRTSLVDGGQVGVGGGWEKADGHSWGCDMKLKERSGWGPQGMLCLGEACGQYSIWGRLGAGGRQAQVEIRLGSGRASSSTLPAYARLLLLQSFCPPRVFLAHLPYRLLSLLLLMFFVHPLPPRPPLSVPPLGPPAQGRRQRGGGGARAASALGAIGPTAQ